MTDTYRTLAIIKPPLGWYTVAEILKMVLEGGLIPARMHMGVLPRAAWEDFYAEHRGRPFFKGLIDHMVSGPSIFMVLEGPNAVEVWRELCGATDPKKAAPGTIRQRFGYKGPANAVHGSATPEDVSREVEVFGNIRG